MNVWNQLEENFDKTQLNIVQFPEELCDSNFIRYGIFYGSSSLKKDIDIIKAGEFLVSIYKKICNEFDGEAYEIRAILVPHTHPGKQFKHNVQRNIAEYTSKFTTDIIEELEKCYMSDTRQQMILATTDYVDSKFYSVVKEMQWDNQKSCKSKVDKGIFSKVKVYYNNYVHPNNIEIKDVVYSVVKITCGSDFGTGFLFRMPDQILCITCNHLLQSIAEHQPQAISDYNDEIIFSLKPIKDVTIFNYGENNLLTAQEEVAILKPQFQGRIPFDMNSILSLENFDNTINNYYNSDCICCGYPDEEQCWSDSFKLVRNGAKGYCQTRIKSTDNPVQQGYSGGIIVLANNSNCILGIHEGRRYDDTIGRMIPCEIILEQIKKDD